MEERIRGLGRTAWWLLGILLVSAVLVTFLSWIRVVFPPLVLGGIIVFLCNPIVTYLHGRGIHRAMGTALTYLGFAAVMIVLGVLLAPLVADQFDQMSERLPEIRDDIEAQIEEWHDRSYAEDWFFKVPTVNEIQDQAGGGGTDDLAEQVSTLRDVGAEIFHVGLILVLGPIIAFYLLVDLPHIRHTIESMVPEHARSRTVFLAHRLNLVVGGFFRGQLAVAFLVGVMTSIGLAIIDLPLWLVVGMIAGLFNIIPLVGPYIGAVPGIVIALATSDVKKAALVALVMVIVQQIDNHFITPTVMRRAVQLHPAAVMLALLVFGSIGGFFGLVLAVPVTACLKVVGGHLWRRYVMGVSVPGLDEPIHPEPPPDDASGAVAAAS